MTEPTGPTGPVTGGRPRVLHLVGSPTSEALADLSRLYAAGCLDALQAPGSRWAGHGHLVAWASPDGSWRLPRDLGAEALAAAPPVGLDAVVAAVREQRPRVALPQMFCLAGMTDVRALPALLGVPMVGNLPATMALAADKVLSRAVVAAAGVDVPDAVVMAPGDAADLSAVAGAPALPVVVKPADADNSEGVTLVRHAVDLPAAVDEAGRHSRRVLVERFVPLGREVRCGVVELGGELVVLPLEEYAVDATTKPVRLRDDKLRGSSGDLALVAKDADHAWVLPPDDPVVPAVREVALACWRALGCRHHALFDFRIDPEGRPWFLEAGLYCSYAPSSVLVVMARAAGIDLDDLLAAGVVAAGA